MRRAAAGRGRVALAALAVAALSTGAAGCGGGEGSGTTTEREPNDVLIITRDDGTGTAIRLRLECESGDRELCAEIARLGPALVPQPDEICTEIYGGPQTITITGRLGGDPVRVVVGRENGCAIDRYDRLERILTDG